MKVSATFSCNNDPGAVISQGRCGRTVNPGCLQSISLQAGDKSQVPVVGPECVPENVDPDTKKAGHEVDPFTHVPAKIPSRAREANQCKGPPQAEIRPCAPCQADSEERSESGGLSFVCDVVSMDLIRSMSRRSLVVGKNPGSVGLHFEPIDLKLPDRRPQGCCRHPNLVAATHFHIPKCSSQMEDVELIATTACIPSPHACPGRIVRVH